MLFFKSVIHDGDCTVTSCKYYDTFKCFYTTYVRLYVYIMTKLCLQFL